MKSAARFASLWFLVLSAALLLASCRAADSGGAGEYKGTIKVGHLVGTCMSPLFLADAKGYFKDEGLSMQLVWTQNPGDAISGINSGALQIIHSPFTATYVANDGGAHLKIIAGSGNGGLVCLAQPNSNIKRIEDLKTESGKKKLKVGSQRINTLEMTFYRTIKNLGLRYDDFEMVYFTDHFSMYSAFETGQLDIVTHVEPYVTQLIAKDHATALSSSNDVWGEGSPDCVTSTTEEFLTKYPVTVHKYLRALLRADRFIKEHLEEAVTVLDQGKYFKVDRETLHDAIPRQPPGVDLRKGQKGMEIAVSDMMDLGYLKKKPSDVVDLTILAQVASEISQSQK